MCNYYNYYKNILIIIIFFKNVIIHLWGFCKGEFTCQACLTCLTIFDKFGTSSNVNKVSQQTILQLNK